MHKFILLSLVFVCLFSCKKEEEPVVADKLLQLSSIRVGTYNLDLHDKEKNKQAPVESPVVISFSAPLDTSTVRSSVTLLKGTEAVSMQFFYLDTNKAISAQSLQALDNNTAYRLVIANTIRGKEGEKYPGIEVEFTTQKGALTITSFTIGDQNALGTNRIQNINRNLQIEVGFSHLVDPQTITNDNIKVVSAGGPSAALTFGIGDDGKTLTISSQEPLEHFTKYTLFFLSLLQGTDGEVFTAINRDFYTAVDIAPKFPLLSDDALLTLIQEKTFTYFWDFAHPVSGMARERDNSGDIVTTGGSGFGLMAILVGIERNFISRTEGIEGLTRIVNFLKTADRFHGAWPHWMNGSTGKVVPFSANDDGGDLVETSFLVQGLLTVRQYLNPADAVELQLAQQITTLWEEVEWDWYTRGGKDVLYWHWSPRVEWAMNFELRGYNEALITYVLAASSPTHPITTSVYQNGWAQNSHFSNGKSFYGIRLPLGFDYGGPLFFAHYSFLGLDPRKLQDTYANYWEQNVNHTLINRAHALQNPGNFVGYGPQNWGFTASDNQDGYSAHSPTNDLGVITPTAAISSLPYTPEYSMEAIRFFYYNIGDKTWGPYGFYDAFNVTRGWFGKSYLAIDQGPMIAMIENYRSALLWNTFMSAPEVKAGLTKLNFTY
ncbi:hypothetical protein GXP67_06535 [Rhodocytophaga rosea]|uniref:Beta-glucosidase n=1 Tax=Rhodocytophaga rosea TaxID=2704465 RepID=A0A6C0GEG1_9BACT|nr:glucoamylase family protein [Rhodocytophaga rosea]QHT66338.1 hypothetical protein GXP67_06535 [Rhodocytophaga rosea]